jgi:hypothetical protein
MNLTEEQAKRILAEISSRKQNRPPPPKPRFNTPAPPKSTALPSPPAATTTSSSPEPIQHQLIEEGMVTDEWIVDGLVDVCEAAPSVATKHGVVVIDGSNELHVAKLGRLSKSAKPSETPVAALPDSMGPMKLGRGPSIADGYAYWVAEHYLMRRPLEPPFGPLDVLAQDARVATRSSALAAADNHPTWVGYIALPTVKNGPLRAKLWFGENSNTLPLSQAEESTLSLALLERAGKPYALSLEARTGQSTLHLRRLTTSTPPAVAEHHIVWVGGNANPTTELRVSTTGGDDLLSLLPLEQGIADFGMAVLSLGEPSTPKTPEVKWVHYANGINPAPVDSARVCGDTVVLFARPSTASPGSPQELVFGRVDQGDLSTSIVLGTSKAFYDLSLVPINGGALINYVADYRTWARSIRCASSSR